MKLDTEINLNFRPREFFRWWGEQLAGMVPVKVRSLFFPRQHYVLCSRNPESLDILIPRGEGIALTRLELGYEALEQRGLYQLLGDQVQQDASRLVLLLQPGQFLHKELLLPAAAAENLQQVASFEMDRQTPFKASQVYFQAKVTEKLAATHQIRVSLILIPREKLDEILKELAALGVFPSLVDLAESAPAQGRYRPVFNLLPASRGAGERDWAKISGWVLSAIFLLLVFAAFSLPIMQENARIEALRDELDAVSQIALKVEGLKSDADRLLEETNFLLEKKRHEPVMVDMLNELTSRMPDNTWLTSLRFKDGRLQIQGNSPSASSLIETLEASQLFDDTRFVSPVTQNNRTKIERFQIEANVKARSRVVPESH